MDTGVYSFTCDACGRFFSVREHKNTRYREIMAAIDNSDALFRDVLKLANKAADITIKSKARRIGEITLKLKDRTRFTIDPSAVLYMTKFCPSCHDEELSKILHGALERAKSIPEKRGFLSKIFGGRS